MSGERRVNCESEEVTIARKVGQNVLNFSTNCSRRNLSAVDGSQSISRS